MKLEIYQTGKLPPLTVVECDGWSIDYDEPVWELEIYKYKDGHKTIIAIFFGNQIAGFKEVGDAECSQ